MYFLLLLSLLCPAHCNYVISLFADVDKDTEFFNRTFPWIIDNIGGDVSVDYYLQGSGRYSVPQMCALEELRHNSFLQAQYLKCEAEGSPSTYCLCETGINPHKFKECVRHGGALASFAAAKFQQVGIDTTPLIEIGPGSTVFRVEDMWYLKKICTIFGDYQPRGCVKPFKCNGTDYGTSLKKSVAQFDKLCTEEPGPFILGCTSTNGPEPNNEDKFYHYTDRLFYK